MAGEFNISIYKKCILNGWKQVGAVDHFFSIDRAAIPKAPTSPLPLLADNGRLRRRLRRHLRLRP